jgi:hypothetical protein
MGKPYNQFSAEPFVNAVGQTINPGDRVAYVTMGYNKRVNQNTGWFDGVLKDPKNGKVVLTRVRGINTRKTMATGNVITKHYKRWDYSTNPPKEVDSHYTYNETVQVDVEPYGKTNLQRHRLFKI